VPYKDKKKQYAYMVERRRQIKLKAIQYLGGKCSRCGYNNCAGALHFHHKDETTKEFGLSNKGLIRSWEKVKKELDKCELLCANCHAEEHWHMV